MALDRSAGFAIEAKSEGLFKESAQADFIDSASISTANVDSRRVRYLIMRLNPSSAIDGQLLPVMPGDT